MNAYIGFAVLAIFPNQSSVHKDYFKDTHSSSLPTEQLIVPISDLQKDSCYNKQRVIRSKRDVITAEECPHLPILGGLILLENSPHKTLSFSENLG